MDLRHLRCFIALAEELHFTRAAERLHIEQSPLSRAIKELETELRVRLFERNPRGTRLTWAGQVFQKDVRRILLAVEQATANARAAASGFRGTLRIALSDGVVPRRLSELLARCRLEEPEVEIRLFEVPLAQQVRGLRNDLYDAGFARSDESGGGLIAQPVWKDPLLVVLPARHPLLAFRAIPFDKVMQYPLVLCHPETCEGRYRQIKRIFRSSGFDPTIAEYVASNDVMLALVAAGYGLGLACHAQIIAYHRSEVVTRRLAGKTPTLTTYLLRPEADAHAQLDRFIARTVGDSQANGSDCTE
ncbi:MAG: LysR family transcriptional regulator [Sulfuritalea sp.]|nr:LysR family transcriptional regulator [Sulfuritalea sp.]